MVYKSDGTNWLVRLKKGELLIENLNKLAEQENIETAWLNGLGGALWAELGFYNLDKNEYRYKKFEELLEITGLQGNLTRVEGKPFLHIHATFSNPDMQAIGGHVKELAVGGTCEIMLQPWKGDTVNRLLDDEIGLKLLNL